MHANHFSYKSLCQNDNQALFPLFKIREFFNSQCSIFMPGQTKIPAWQVWLNYYNFSLFSICTIDLCVTRVLTCVCCTVVVVMLTSVWSCLEFDQDIAQPINYKATYAPFFCVQFIVHTLYLFLKRECNCYLKKDDTDKCAHTMAAPPDRV